jgi:prolipoprotein diacylglyceryltransferase
VFTARFLVEFVKEPQIPEMADATLNLGQWYSIPAVLVGVWLVWSSRKRVPRA